MISIVRSIFNKIGVDGAVAYTVFSRIIQAGGGVISVVFISRFLSPNEQGYYYTFSSILAIQIFFELGLSGIITQYTAHEFAHLKLESKFDLVGDAYYKSRLSSLLRFCVKWFGIVSILVFFLLLATGYYFFSTYNKGQNVQWQNPWIILCLSTSASLFIDPLLAFFDGLGEVKDMAKVRFIQRVIYILALYILFVLGFKLYSAAIASIIAIGVNYFQVFFSHRIKLLKIIWQSKGEWVINYLKEIFPFQWKIALSWISGYFIFQLFNPVLFATEGSIIAGQMGMTLAALNGVLSISLSWVNTKVPLFSNLIAKNEFKSLDKIFNKTVKQANLICGLCLIVFMIVVYEVRLLKIPVGNRFLPILPLILLCVATFVNQFISALATYLRCHKQEPFLVQSIVMGLLTGTSTIVLGKLFGLNGIVIGYCSLIVFVGLTWSIWIFINKKRKWHA